MEPHAVKGIPDVVMGNPVAATDFSVTATVPLGRSPVPEARPSAPPGGKTRRNPLARRPRHESPRSRHRAGAGNGREER